jgi:hypothetical protein
MKEIKDLIPDIYALLAHGEHKVNTENLDECLGAIRSAIIEAIETPQDLHPEAKLRLSKTGTGLRKTWFEHNTVKEPGNGPDPMKVGPNLMRFLTGHITEAVLILMAKETGHTVEHAQAEVELEGVPGHCDAVIDGHMTDIKTASQFSYDKFRTGDITSGNDPFGYVAQLSAYRRALLNNGVVLKPTSYFWAYNKSNSEMVLTPLYDSQVVDAAGMIKDQKAAVNFPTPPKELCYPEEEVGKSGNMSIGKNCAFCAFKFECFKDANEGKGLRAFKYAKGPVYLSKVIETPKVEEIT